MSGNKFVNPYNFVPLQKECKRKVVERGTLTGVIEYSLLTKTPMFIPDTNDVESEELKKQKENGEIVKVNHYKYKFFSYGDGIPVIPGSEMRGMLRSNFEILTNSCLSGIDDKSVLSKRTNEVFKAGLIKKNGKQYDLYEADDCLLRAELIDGKLEDNWVDDVTHWGKKYYKDASLVFKEGQKVYFTYQERIKDRKVNGKPLALAVQCEEDSSKEKGYVIMGEDGPRQRNIRRTQKHCCHIFTLKKKKNNAGVLELKNGRIQTEEVLIVEKIDTGILDKNLAEYKNNGKNIYDKYKEQWSLFKDEGADGEYFPVYYSAIGKKIVFLSPACITREVYITKIEDLINEHKTCDGKKGLCPACSLFGMLNNGVNSVSRVRVTDMYVDEKTVINESYERELCIRPLSTPKLNNMEFYMKRPNENAWFWTYDYYVDKDGNIHILEDDDKEINGRKFYWHNMNVDLDRITASKNDLNKTIRPLKAGMGFKGKVYFENITDTELKQLIYVLNGGNFDFETSIENRKHGYKLGAAKPLGLGSVALMVDKVMLREIKTVKCEEKIAIDENMYDGLNSKLDENDLFKEEIINAFKKITNFDAVADMNISYPMINPDRENKGFEWFGNNHKAYSKKNGRKEYVGWPDQRKQMVYMEYLEPMEPDLKKVIPDGAIMEQDRVNGVSRRNDTYQGHERRRR